MIAAAERRAVAAGNALAKSLQRVEKSRIGSAVARGAARAPGRLPARGGGAGRGPRARRAPDRLGQLEAIVIHAHGLLYAPERVHLGIALWHVLVAFPVAVRRYWAGAALAAALLVGGGALGLARGPTGPHRCGRPVVGRAAGQRRVLPEELFSARRRSGLRGLLLHQQRARFAVGVRAGRYVRRRHRADPHLQRRDSRRHRSPSSRRTARSRPCSPTSCRTRAWS